MALGSNPAQTSEFLALRGNDPSPCLPHETESEVYWITTGVIHTTL